MILCEQYAALDSKKRAEFREALFNLYREFDKDAMSVGDYLARQTIDSLKML